MRKLIALLIIRLLSLEPEDLVFKYRIGATVNEQGKVFIEVLEQRPSYLVHRHETGQKHVMSEDMVTKYIEDPFNRTLVQ